MKEIYGSFAALAAERYSCRKFDSRPVEREKIEAILKAGLEAPTACNNRPQRILVIESDEALTRLRRCTMSHYGCSLAMLVCVEKEACYRRDYDGRPSGDIDAAIVTTHMMLQAHALGVCSTWVMHFIPEAICCEMSLPDGYDAVSLLVMGYPAADAQPGPRHYDKGGADERVFYNRFER